MEQELRWLHASNRAVLNSLAMGVCTLNQQGIVQSLNQEAVRLLGWGEAVCQGQSFHDLTHCRSLPDKLTQEFCPVAHMLQTGKPIWLPRAGLKVRSGAWLVVELTCTPLFDEGASGAVLSFRDLATQIQMEEDLRRLASIPEESPFPIVELDLQANMLYANPSMTRLMEQAGFREEGFSAALPHDVKKIVKRCLERGLSEKDVEVDVGQKLFAWLFCPLKDLQLVRGYGMDVTERKNAADELGQFVEVLGQKNQELDEALTKAEAATRAKAAFLATMSHEIRTPLNGIIGMTALLSESSLTLEQREDAGTIQKSAEGLLTIINDILDFSKIEAGKVNLETIEFDLPSLLEDVLDLLALRAHDKGLHLVGLISDDVPSCLQGDPVRLRQILTNLIGNAIKFTDQGEVVVEVKAKVCNRMTDSISGLDGENVLALHFTVRDTGIGLTPEGQRRLFQAFSQADSSTTRKYGGTGLGLAISKQLTELMGGAIGVSSIPDQGSEFWVTLPFPSSSCNNSPSFPEMSRLQGHSVLLLEAHEPTKQGIAELLRAVDVSCQSVGSLAEAVAALRERPSQSKVFHAAIIDPEGLGEDPKIVIQALRQAMGPSTVPLVLLLGGSRGHSERALEAGVDVWLTKPLRRLRLYTCLDSLIHQPGSSAPTHQPLRQAEVAEREAGGGGTPYGFHGRILLAEDNPINLKVILGMLKKTGIEVDAVMNGKEACEAISKQSYDLVFMDWQMPHMDGLQATQEIRRREALKGDCKGGGVRSKEQEESGVNTPHSSLSSPHRIPIIAMTANAMSGDREKCLAAGMDDYLVKPLRLSAVVDVLTQWLPTHSPSSMNEPMEASGSRTVKPEDGNLEREAGRSRESMPEVPTLWDANVALSHMDGDQVLLRELMELFVETAPATLSMMRDAIDRHDYQTAERSAHTMKGSIGTFRAEQVVACAAELERAALDHRRNDLELAYTRLAGYITELLQDFQKYIKASCEENYS